MEPSSLTFLCEPKEEASDGWPRDATDDSLESEDSGRDGTASGKEVLGYGSTPTGSWRSSSFTSEVQEILNTLIIKTYMHQQKYISTWFLFSPCITNIYINTYKSVLKVCTIIHI